MKPIIFLFTIFIGTVAFAQLPTLVSDPTTHIRMGAVIAQSAKEVQEARKIFLTLKETADFIKKVSKSIKQLDLIARVIHNQAVAFQRAQDAMKRATESGQFSVSELNMITYNFTILLSATNRSVSLAQSLIEDGFFNMSDSERLELLIGLERGVNSSRLDIVRLYEDYERTANKRKMISIFGAK